MKNKKSAKDLAFERERAKLRKEIQELEYRISEKDKHIIELEQIIGKCNVKIQQQEDWIRRLLEYMDMPEEEMRKRIENERVKDEILDTLGEFGQIFRRFGIL